MVITANELKVKGVNAFAESLQKYESAFISVRGKTEYVLMTKREYNRLYEEETLNAWKNAKNDIRIGNFQSSVSDHLNDIRP